MKVILSYLNRETADSILTFPTTIQLIFSEEEFNKLNVAGLVSIKKHGVTVKSKAIEDRKEVIVIIKSNDNIFDHIEAIEEILSVKILAERHFLKIINEIKKLAKDYQKIDDHIYGITIYEIQQSIFLMLKRINVLRKFKDDLLNSERILSKNELEKIVAEAKEMESLIDDNINRLNKIKNKLNRTEPNQISIDVISSIGRSISELTTQKGQLQDLIYFNDIHFYRKKIQDLIDQINLRLPSADSVFNSYKVRIENLIARLISDSGENIVLPNVANSYLVVSRIDSIMDIMKKNNLFNAENFQLFLGELEAEKDIEKLQNRIYKIYSRLNNISAVSLLMQKNFEHVIRDAFIDKSCTARTETQFQFFGKASNDKSENQINWSHYCTGVEANIALMLHAKQPLTEVYQYAFDTRKQIARLRNESSSFGIRRAGKSPTDSYKEKDKSVVANKVFPEIRQLLIEEYQFDKSEFQKSFTLVLPTANTNQQFILPTETITIEFGKNDDGIINPIEVHVKFEAPDDIETFNQALHYFDKTFLSKIRNKEYTTEDDFLTDLGIFTFYMARFYPLDRGSGATTQWVVRGIVQYYTNGMVDLADIRLGNSPHRDQNIPYDVYAQLVQDPIKYAKAFKQSLQNEFRRSQAPNLLQTKMS